MQWGVGRYTAGGWQVPEGAGWAALSMGGRPRPALLGLCLATHTHTGAADTTCNWV